MIYVHVNRLAIARNMKDGGSRPTILVFADRDAKRPASAARVEFTGPATLVDNREAVMKHSDARVVMVTNDPVELYGYDGELIQTITPLQHVAPADKVKT